MFKVVETFSGIGSQAKALKNIGIDYSIEKTVEWDINAIIAYCLIHKGKIDIQKYENISDEEIFEFLSNQTLSREGKEPITEKGLKSLSVLVRRSIYSAIKETSNLVSITDVQGKDIPDDTDLLTYSFPCQDLSLCSCWHGNQTGISRNVKNRSGMLWEIERILGEMKSNKQPLPRFLLMENVTNILSKRHEKDFNSWKKELERLGYYNKVYRLNALDFGIPQNRKRAYMISIYCNFDIEMKKKLDMYFENNNLEKNNLKFVRRKLEINDILRLNYENAQYLKEAYLSNPNNTPSRKKIKEDNVMLHDGKKQLFSFAKTLTTKQDRNPNSGLIGFQPGDSKKAKWRYLTPRECFLLMGFDERDYNKVIENNIPTTRTRKFFTLEKLIKLAGNSIVVDVLEAIFRQIIEIDESIVKHPEMRCNVKK